MDRLRRAFASRRRRWAAVAVGASLAGLVVVGLVRDGEVALRADGGFWGSTGRDVPYASFLAEPLCVPADEAVTIESVRGLGAEGGAEVTGFSVVTAASGLDGVTMSRISDEPQYEGSHRVAAPCGAHDSFATLVVEVHRPGESDAVVEGLRVRYRDTHDTRTVDLDTRLGICPSTRDTDASCLD